MLRLFVCWFVRWLVLFEGSMLAKIIIVVLVTRGFNKKYIQARQSNIENDGWAQARQNEFRVCLETVT